MEPRQVNGHDRGEIALAIFDLTQNAAERWRGSNRAVPREILGLVV
jgi:hypothetical protein